MPAILTPPSTLEICEPFGAALGHEFEPVLLPDGRVRQPVGRAAAAWILEMTAAERELGYRAVTTYPEAVERDV